MVVTLPFVLLLLDYWPFHRFQSGQPAEIVTSKLQNSNITRLILEKAPFFLVTAIISILTFFTQQEGGAVKSMVSYPLTVRVANMLVSYVTYIGKMIWPQSLSVLYPHPGALPLWQSVGAFILIASIFYMVISEIKTRPYLFVGWLWYMGTLAPVNGLVVIGPHAMADRYTYVPLIGLFIIIAWGVPELLAKWRLKVAGIAIMATAVLSALSIMSWFQVQYWQNSITLFEHTLDVTENNYTIHNNLGIALAKAGRSIEANRQYLEALRIKPDFVEAHLNLGNLLMGMDKMDEAMEHFHKALKIYPDFRGVHYSLGRAQSKLGRTEAAIRHYSRELQLAPNDADVHNNMGLLLVKQGRVWAAISHFEKALYIDSGHTNAYKNLNNILKAQKKYNNENLTKALSALKLNPESPELHDHVGSLYKGIGDLNKAVYHYKKALAIEPGSAVILSHLAMVYAMQGNYDKSRSLFKRAIASAPDRWEAYYYIAGTYARQNNVNEAVKWLEKSVQKGFSDWGLMMADKNLEKIKHTEYYNELIKAR
jgi:tetratricopeptide (TPR) repeat protein